MWLNKNIYIIHLFVLNFLIFQLPVCLLHYIVNLQAIGSIRFVNVLF